MRVAHDVHQKNFERNVLSGDGVRSLEPLQADEQGISLTLNANGMIVVTWQKKGLNESCSCGSQVKKKCCSKVNIVSNICNIRICKLIIYK